MLNFLTQTMGRFGPGLGRFGPRLWAVFDPDWAVLDRDDGPFWTEIVGRF